MNIIILGDGLLGSEIIKLTEWTYISRKKDGINFLNVKTYAKFIDQYDIIVNCIGYTDTYSDNKENHYNINYKGVVDLSDYCEKNKKKLVHISTDYVYEYSIDNASEDDLPLISQNWYSYYKLLSDEYLTLKNSNHLICRCSFKPRPFPYEKAWINQIGNFDYPDVISSIIIKLINENCTGIYNVGTELKTMYELAVQTNKDVKKEYKPPYVPLNTSMNLNKLHKIIF